jgi:O-succinylbenzoic acid--CoA ligase
VLTLDELLAGATAPSPPPTLDAAEHAAVIVATSGTTGTPKGAVLTHGALAASAAAWNEFLPPATGWLASLSTAHVGGLGVIWRAALSGRPVVVPAGSDTASLLGAVSDPRVSHVSLVAAQLARILNATGTAPAPSNLRAVLLGGGPIPSGIVTRALALRWPVVPTYGMTETASGVTALATAEAAGHPDSAGRALPGVELRVTRPGSDGIGEIEVRGPSVFSGYVGAGPESADAFTSDGWYRTGDMGRIDGEGYLTVADRRLDLIVSGGENVYPAEVEAVLASHPAVADAGVTGRADSRWAAVPVAAIALRPGASAADEDLRAYCHARLAAFKVPVAFLRLPVLPRTSAGKLQRVALRDLIDAAASAAVAQESSPLPPSPEPPVRRPDQAVRHVARPDGTRIAYRRFDATTPDAALPAAPRRPEFDAILLLHATLSNGRQLEPLARLLAEEAPILVPDRRGSGARSLVRPGPVPLDEQVADALALLDAEGVERAAVVGHSFGGLLALAIAAAAPQRVADVVAYEPPIVQALGAGELGEMAGLGPRVAAAYEAGGAPAAAEVFLRAIGSSAMLDALPAAQRSALLARGDSVIADLGFLDRAAFDASKIVCPVTIVTGGASEPFYVAIAAALTRAIATAGHQEMPGARHDAPITQPARFAEIVRIALARSRQPS